MSKNVRYHAARRLAQALERVVEESKQHNDDEVTMFALVAALGGLSEDDPRVLSRAQALVELPALLRKELARVDRDELGYAEVGLKVLDETLNTRSLYRPWREVSARLVETAMPALSICSLMLDSLPGEALIDERELSRLFDEARELLEDVRLMSGGSSEVLRFVEASLVEILQAIEEYWLRGSVIIERAVDSTIGRAVREQSFERSSKETKPILKRLGIILARVAVVVAVANDLDSLPSTVHDIIGGVVEITTGHDIDQPVVVTPPDTTEPDDITPTQSDR